MADITTKAVLREGQQEARWISDPAGPTDTITLEGFDQFHGLVTFGVQAFDAEGELLESAVTGEITVTAKTWYTERWEPVPAAHSPIDLAAPATGQYVGSATGLRFTPGEGGTALAGVTTWRAYVGIYAWR